MYVLKGNKMRFLAPTKAALLVALVLLLALASCLGAVPTPNPTASSYPVRTAESSEATTPTLPPSPSLTPTPSVITTPTATQTATPTPTATPNIGTAMWCGEESQSNFSKQFPALYNAIKAAGPVPFCIEGPLPQGAKIGAIPYYNQCEMASPAGSPICQSDGGAVAAKIALEYATGEPQNIDELFANLNATSSTTTNYDELRKVALWAVGSGEEERISPLSWTELNNIIGKGGVVIMRTKDPLYEGQLPCDGSCPSSDQYFVIVGITDNELVVNYSLTTSDPKDFQNGRNLIISRDNAERVFFREQSNPKLVIMPRAGNETPTLAEYTGIVTYCGTAREIFKETHPKEFATSGAAGTGLERPACVQGPAPDDALMWKVDFYPQGPYKENDPLSIGGSGVLNMAMVLKVFGFDPTGIDIWAMAYVLNPGLKAAVDAKNAELADQIIKRGAPLDSMVYFAYDEKMLRRVGERMDFGDLESELEQGHLIMMNVDGTSYGQQKYCLDACSQGNNLYLLITGIAPDSKAIIVKDTSGMYDNLVLSWDIVSNGIYADKDKGVEMVVGPPTK